MKWFFLTTSVWNSMESESSQRSAFNFTLYGFISGTWRGGPHRWEGWLRWWSWRRRTPGRRCCAPLPLPPLVGRGRAFADTFPETGGEEDLTEISLKHIRRSRWQILAAWLRCLSAAMLLHSFTLITNGWITSTGIVSKRHWRDTLPVYIAAHLVLLFCGRLWRWRQGWQGESKAAKLVTSQNVQFQIGRQHKRLQRDSPHRVHPHLLTGQFWNEFVPVSIKFGNV